MGRACLGGRGLFFSCEPAVVAGEWKFQEAVFFDGATPKVMDD